MTTRLRIVALLGAIALLAAACGDDSSGDTGADATAAPADTTDTTQMTDTTQATAPATTAAAEMDDDMDEDMADEMTSDGSCDAVALRLDVATLPPLGGGAHYEGWAIIDGAPISTGKFQVVDGLALLMDGSPAECFNADGLETATTLVITIEPTGDADDVPADTHIVAGDVTNGSATLAVGHPAALGTDFSDAAGTFLLATPTDGNGTNELSGIWFLELPGPTSSLVLPTLPAGWVYEGWAVIDGVPVTSGTFLAAEGFDDFDGFSGDQGGPPFPGEDYLVNAPAGVTFPTDLSGGTVVISVEPSPDDAPEPFVIKPLLGIAGDPATDHESYPLNNNAVDLPSVIAVIS